MATYLDLEGIGLPIRRQAAVSSRGAADADRLAALGPEGVFDPSLLGMAGDPAFYQQLPGGLLVQWGEVPFHKVKRLRVTFPVAFQAGAHCIQITPESNGHKTELEEPLMIRNKTNTGFEIVGKKSKNLTVYWLAMGQ